MCLCGHIATRIGKKSWDAASECSTIYVMDQCHAWGEWANNISATVPKKGRCEEAIASTSSPSGRSILAHRPGEVQRNGPPHLRRLGAMGELQMKSKLTKLAAAGVLSLCTAAPALAGSVTQPGETVGLNAGTPLAPGWYAINTVDWGCTPRSTHVRVSPFRLSLGQRRGRFWAGEYSCWRRGLGWKSACNATYPSIQAPTLPVCTTRRRSANWPGTSAMDGGLATRLELISSTIARWRGPTPRSISGLR